ncbi:MAG TPA: hypothetical protein HA362_06940 [Nanoarchaeota archaeon]|nr:hypothetical protein [Nanoarchaeota archaeon]
MSMKPMAAAAAGALSLYAGNAEAEFTPTLECDDVETIEFHGTLFYACEEDVTPEIMAEFDLIAKVKEYEREKLGFSETPNYREYRNGLPGREIEGVYLLDVVPPMQIAQDLVSVHLQSAMQYREPVAVPTHFWSMEDDLSDEEVFYRGQGLDVHRRFTSNFGSGCALDPDFIERDTARKIYTVLHEDLHNHNIYVWGKRLDRDLEEASANVFGKVATIDYVGLYYGTGTQIYEDSANQLEDELKYAEFLISIYNEIEAISADDISDEEKARQQGAVIARAGRHYSNITNISSILNDIPYRRLFPLMYEVYKAQPDMGTFVDVLKEMPANEYAAIGYLERHCNGCSYSPLTRHVIW